MTYLRLAVLIEIIELTALCHSEDSATILFSVYKDKNVSFHSM
jgi:hypothetical protein